MIPRILKKLFSTCAEKPALTAQMPVRVFQCKYNGHFEDIPTKRDAFAVRIIELARVEQAEIYFHKMLTKDTRFLHAPAVALEANESFLKKVETLEGFFSAYPVWEGMKTERSNSWMKYYSCRVEESKKLKP